MGRQTASAKSEGCFRNSLRHYWPSERMTAIKAAAPFPWSVEDSIERAAALLMAYKAAGQDVFVWRQPVPMFRYGPGGAREGWNWGIRLALGMGGWCTGYSRGVNMPLPLLADLPENPWRPSAEACQAVERLIARFDLGAIKIIDPTAVAEQDRPATKSKSTTSEDRPRQMRAWNYNKSPARAVRLRRAAASAARRGYF